MSSAAVKNHPMKDSMTKSSSSKRLKRTVDLSKPPRNSGCKGRPPGSRSSSKSSKSGRSKPGDKKGDKKKPSSSKNKSGGSQRSGKGSSSKSSRSGSKKRKSGSSTRSKKGGDGSKKVSSSSAEKKPRGDTIKLSCGKDVYYVSARSFAACSKLIKKELSVNAHARSVDLRQFDKTTVRVLAEYIESKKIKTDISFYSLAELLKFSKVFEMDNLRTQLENFITVIASNDLATLHQVLLIIGITPVSRPTEKTILEKAARSFMELAGQNTFQRIPFNIAITLFARCDLNVKHEIQVVDAMLLWLAGQPNLPIVVPALFYLVRYDFLHAVEKAFIIERARALRFPADVVSVIERCFECKNGARICILKPHYEAKLARCGVADPSLMEGKSPNMPLSLPRDAIIYKASEAEPVEKEKEKTAFQSSQARPYYHAPPACAGKSSRRADKSCKKTTADKSGKKTTKKKSSTAESSSKRGKRDGSKSNRSHKSSRSTKSAKSVKSSSSGKKLKKGGSSKTKKLSGRKGKSSGKK